MPRLPAILKSPASQAVFARLVEVFDRLGPYALEEKKTSIHVVHGHAFAGINPRATGVILTIVLDRPLRHARVRKSEQSSARRHHVEFLLESPSDVDRELAGWIREAYARASERRATGARDGATSRRTRN